MRINIFGSATILASSSGLSAKAVNTELLHHQLLRHMSNKGLLRDLYLKGGFALRMVHRYHRLTDKIELGCGQDIDIDALTTYFKGAERDIGIEITLVIDKDILLIPSHSKSLAGRSINVTINRQSKSFRSPKLTKSDLESQLSDTNLIVNCPSTAEIMTGLIVDATQWTEGTHWTELWDLSRVYLAVRDINDSLLEDSIKDANCQGFSDLLMKQVSLLRPAFYDPRFREAMEGWLSSDIMNKTLGYPQYLQVIVRGLEDLFRSVSQKMAHLE